MKLIGENDTLLEFLSGEYSLISSSLYKVDLFKEENELIIECHFKIIYSKPENLIKIRFSGIKEFSFYHNSDYDFYNVESLKFLKSNDSIYLSLDPYEMDIDISKNDQDFILASKASGWLIE